MSQLDEFLTQGLRYGMLEDKQIVLSPSALEKIKQQHPENVEEIEDEMADGYFLGAFGVRIPYVVREQVAPNTAFMLDRKLVSRMP